MSHNHIAGLGNADLAALVRQGNAEAIGVAVARAQRPTVRVKTRRMLAQVLADAGIAVVVDAGVKPKQAKAKKPKQAKVKDPHTELRKKAWAHRAEEFKKGNKITYAQACEKFGTFPARKAKANA